jgi:hypothetical protein
LYIAELDTKYNGVYTGSYQKWIKLVFPDAYQNIHKKLTVSNLTGLNLYLGPFFERIMILALKMLDCVCGTWYIQNGDEGMRSRLGDPL